MPILDGATNNEMAVKLAPSDGRDQQLTKFSAAIAAATAAAIAAAAAAAAQPLRGRGPPRTFLKALAVNLA